MPFIRITLGRTLPAPAKQRLARGCTDLIVDILGKRRAVTAVLVEAVAGDGWSINGEIVGDELLGGENPVPVHAEICITAGTNSPAEKSRMIAALQALLHEALGATPQASYIVIRELPADDWGYAGITQAARRQLISAVAA